MLQRFDMLKQVHPPKQIDKNGIPIKLDFAVADNGFLTKEVEASIKKMKFTPARKNGEKVQSYLFINHKLKLGQKK